MFKRLRTLILSQPADSKSPRHRLNTESSRHRKPRSSAPAAIIVLGALVAGLSITIPVSATVNGCTSVIADNPVSTPPGNSNPEPLVLDANANLIGQTLSTFQPNLDDGYSDPIKLPFNLGTASGNSKILVGTNGTVQLLDDQTAFNVFNADLDLSSQGSVFAGECSVNLNGTVYPAYFVTWDQVNFYGDASSNVTMQIIFVKTSAWSYSVIKNYSKLEASTPGSLSFGYTCPFDPSGDWCSTTFNQIANADVSLNADLTYGADLLEGGSTDLTTHKSLSTTQLGRYVHEVSRNVSLCSQNASPVMTVTYSEPGVQSVNPNFASVTEDFDSFDTSSQYVQTPLATAVGLLEGSAVAFPANLYGGAGYTGNGFAAIDATLSAPPATCYKYMGFWWSAGSENNSIQLLDENGTVLASFTTQDLFQSLAAVDGQAPCPDAGNLYCGNPNYVSGVSDDSLWPHGAAPNEPFAYVNLRFPAGFKKIRLFGTGFELDNVSLATAVPGASVDETFLSGEDPSSPSPSPSPSGSASNQALSIQGLSSNGSLSRTAYTIMGTPTTTTAGWYRCDNAFVDSQTMPSGTCTSVNSDATDYTPLLADIGKYMVYKVTASISGGTSVTQIVDGGPALSMNSLVAKVFGDLAVNLTNSNATAQLTPIPTHPDLTQVDGAWLICNSSASSYISDLRASALQQLQSNLLVGAGCSPVGAMQNATDIPVISNYFGKHVTYFYMGQETADNTRALLVYRSVLVPTPTPSQSPSPSPSATPSQTASPTPSPSPSNTQLFAPGGGAIPTSSPSPSVTPTPAPSAKPTPSATTTPKTSGPVPAKPESPVLEAVPSGKGDLSSAGVKIQSKYPSGEVEQLEDVVVPPTNVAAPLIQTRQNSKKLSVASILDPVANPAIGAPGVDGQTPATFTALASPASAKTFTENLSQLFAMLAGLTLAGVASTRAASRKKTTGALPGNLDASRDPFASSAKAWGDKLEVWKLRPATFLDKPSVWFTTKSAKLSPLVSKIFNDGSYLRAVFGSFTLIAPAISAVIAIYTVQTSGGLIANTAWTALLLLSWIAIFDALAGLVGILAYAISFWILVQHVDVWQDIRVLLGTSLIIIGPSLLMTAFRTIRRQAALGTKHWWERVSDLAIGPFISGWSMSIFVSALPAIAGQTLSVANHVLLFAVIIALSAVVRVLAEEFAAQNYPERMDKLTPDEIPDSSRAQKAVSLTVRYLFWVFMAAGVLGNSWQLWVGSGIVLIPQVLSWYEDEVPNSPTIWRLLPTGVPGLAFGLLVTGWTTTVLSYLVISSAHLAKWAFVILPMPLIVFALLASFGRFGDTEDEIKPTKRNKYVYRIGGVVMLAITMRLAGVV